jgi:voltage-gated potassium channel
VVDFIELATRSEHIELQLEEARIDPQSTLVGNNLKDSRLRSDLRVSAHFREFW